MSPATITRAQAFEQFVDRLGLRHFRGREFTPYWSRTRGGARNTIPPEALWPNIVPTLVVLDEARHRLGAPVHLLSTYRAPAYNAAVGGEPASFHMAFRAIDFACDVGTPATWAALLRAMRGHPFALPGHAGTFEFRGGIGTYHHSGFVHVDTRGYDANWTG